MHFPAAKEVGQLTSDLAGKANRSCTKALRPKDTRKMHVQTCDGQNISTVHSSEIELAGFSIDNTVSVLLNS